MARAVAAATVPAGVLALLLLGTTLYGAVQGADPRLATAAAGALLAAAHGILLFEVVAQVGAGEGLAAALYLYPLRPALIHGAETLSGSLSPALLMASVGLLALGARGAAIAPFGLLWAGLGVLYLVAFRQFARLLLSRLLRRRRLRELAMALLSLGILGLWFGVNWLAGRLDAQAAQAWLDQAPAALWAVPLLWFSSPVSAAEIPGWARLVAGLGAPTLVVVTYLAGAWLQDQACYGEADGSSLAPRRRGPRRARRHLADRWPATWVPPAVWATAARELKSLRRDPFLLVMLSSQGALLLLPFVLLPSLRRGASMGPAFLLVLLLVSQGARLSNVVATEGRGLLFLAQCPAPRAQVLLGKNLAYFALFAPVNVAFSLALAALMGAPSAAVDLALFSVLGLLVELGAGNAISVLFPVAHMGARAQQGGHRAAAAAGEGGAELPGCGARIGRALASQATLLLLAVPGALILLASHLLGGAARWPSLLAALAFSVLVHVLGTAFAAGRWLGTEQELVDRFATRGAQ